MTRYVGAILGRGGHGRTNVLLETLSRMLSAGLDLARIGGFVLRPTYAANHAGFASSGYEAWLPRHGLHVPVAHLVVDHLGSAGQTPGTSDRPDALAVDHEALARVLQLARKDATSQDVIVLLIDDCAAMAGKPSNRRHRNARTLADLYESVLEGVTPVALVALATGNFATTTTMRQALDAMAPNGQLWPDRMVVDRCSHRYMPDLMHARIAASQALGA